MIVVTANGARTRSLGIVDDIPIVIGKIKIPTSFQVLDSKDEVLILGNNWLKEANATMSWEQSTLTIRKHNVTVRIRITFTKTAKVTTQELDYDSEDDYYEDELLDEYYVYYSDMTDEEEVSEDEMTYNPWSDVYSPYNSEGETEDEETQINNPAVFLAESAKESSEKEQNFEDQHVGPLDYHQQQAFQHLLEEYVDICAKGQTEVGQTTIVKHKIHTGDALPVAQKPYRTNPENT